MARWRLNTADYLLGWNYALPASKKARGHANSDQPADHDAVPLVRSSGNVFADLVLDNAD